MGYVAGLFGLAAPMALLGAFLHYSGRAERRRRAQLSVKPRQTLIQASADEPADTFALWQARISKEPASEAAAEMQKAADPPRPSQS